MESHRTRRAARRILPLAIVFSLVPLSVGWHWAKLGWRDWHYNYPSTPTGYDQIVNRFGQPCNSNAYAIQMAWRAADNGKTY